MAGKYLLSTLGCKVNQYESQQIRELVESLGMHPVCAGERPQLAIVNTCAVTTTAMRKSRQAIRRCAAGGSTPVVVVGCGASAEADRIHQLDGVTAVIDHRSDICAELRELLHNRLDRPSAEADASGHPVAEGAGEPRKSEGYEVSMKPVGPKSAHGAQTPRLPSSPPEIISSNSTDVKAADALVGRIDRFAGHQRAYLKVQDGCDALCTFCAIPDLRPSLRSKPIGIVVEEARALVNSGHKEIVVTGVFLGAYYRATAVRRRFASGPAPLVALVEALARVEGLERLRLSSLEPGDVEDRLLEVLAGYPICVPHLHLPLQSGSEAILRRMNRQYTPEAYVAMIDRVRARLSRPAITTDVIVGFPGETERDFEASLDIARYAGFLKIHAFPFSPRAGTPAARWRADFVDSRTVRDRMHRLAAVERECSIAFRRRFVGCVERVIVEESARAGGTIRSATRQGRTDRYFEVRFEAGHDVNAGDLARVRIDEVTSTGTHGTLIQ